jgi:hypothetical protein
MKPDLCGVTKVVEMPQHRDGEHDPVEAEPLAALIPFDVLAVIFSFLPIQDVVNSCSTLNKHWREAARAYNLPTVTLRREYAESSSKIVAVQMAWPRLVQLGFESTVSKITRKYV